MEKGEKGAQAFVPEWLKGSSNGSSVNSNQYFSSSLLSDEHVSGRPSRNRLLVSACDQDAPRTNPFRRSMSSNSNGSVNTDRDNFSYSRSYSSFGRNHRDRDREKDPDPRDRDRPFMSDSTDLLVTSRNGEDHVRRSLMMASGKPGESLHRSHVSEMSNGVVVSVGHRTTFDKEFPSLGADERQGNQERGRVSSPGLSSAVQNLPFSSSPLLGIDRWTSALAEVPQMAGVTGAVVSSTTQIAPVSPVFTVSSSSTGLNMAETLAQVPSRVRTAPQVPDDNQRLEERSRRQCTILIPMTPTMPKSSAIISSEKSKTKGARCGDGHVNPILRTSSRSDASKTSLSGNLQVLHRERNVLSPTAKDAQSLTNANRSVNPLGPVPLVAAPSPKNNFTTKGRADGKGTVQSYAQISSVEKKANPQVQNRNDFFNSLRKKKSNGNHATTSANLSTSSNLEKGSGALGLSSDSQDRVYSAPSSGLDCPMENGNGAARGCDVGKEFEELIQGNGECSEIIPDPEEKAFLKSLGWDENATEEALTPEEIAGFLKEYKKINPSGQLPHLQNACDNGSQPLSDSA